MSDDIRFSCQHCGQSLEAPTDMAGTVVDCPGCKRPITVPAPEPEVAKPRVRVSPRPTQPPSQSPVVSWTAIIVGAAVIGAVVAAVVIAVIAIDMWRHSSDTKMNTVATESTVAEITPPVVQEIERQGLQEREKVIAPQSNPPTAVHSTAPMPAAQPVLPTISEGERQNRDLLIKMITDGSLYSSANEVPKALATYNLLFAMVDTIDIRDATLRKLIDQARTDRDQIIRKEQAAKMEIHGKVRLVKKNGEYVFPPTKILLAESGSPAAKSFVSLYNAVNSFNESTASIPKKITERTLQYANSKFTELSYAVSRRNNCIRNIQIAVTDGNGIVVSQSDRQGCFLLSGVSPGIYTLMAMAQVDKQPVLWVGTVDKKSDSASTVDLSNDTALFGETKNTDGSDCSWTW